MSDTTDVTEAEFDALADLLSEKRDEWPRLVDDMDSGDLADEIFKAGYRKPRIISTVEELNALPERTLVLDLEGNDWRKGLDGLWCDRDLNHGERSKTVLWQGTDGPSVTVLYVPISPEGGETK